MCLPSPGLAWYVCRMRRETGMNGERWEWMSRVKSKLWNALEVKDRTRPSGLKTRQIVCISKASSPPPKKSCLLMQPMWCITWRLWSMKWKSEVFGAQPTWYKISPQPLTSHATVGKLLTLSEFQFSHVNKEMKSTFYSSALQRGRHKPSVTVAFGM